MPTSLEPEFVKAVSRKTLSNRSVREYALFYSKSERGGKFYRVSRTFIESVEADLNALIRQLANSEHTATLLPYDRKLLLPRAKRKVAEQLELAARLIIRGKVRRHPTIGHTLR